MLLAPVLLLLLKAALALQPGLLLAALLLFLLLALPLRGGGPGRFIVLLQQLSADDLLENGEDILGDPVHRQTGGDGKADPQGHQRHHDHHGAVGLGHGLILRLIVHLVGLKADLHGQQGDAHRHQGQQEQSNGSPAKASGPEIPLGDVGQVDPQEGEVHHEQLGAGVAQQGLEGGQVVRVDHGRKVHLVIGAVLEHRGELPVGHLLDQLLHGGRGDPAAAHSHGLPIQLLGDELDLLHGQPHEVGQWLTDDPVQHHQEQNGDEGPEAAAHGVDLFLLIELLDLQIIALPVLAVLLLQLLHFAGEQIHLDHASLSLQAEGEQHQLDDEGK